MCFTESALKNLKRVPKKELFSDKEQETMEHAARKEMEKWVDTWKRAGPALEAVKQRELRAYDYDKNQAILDEMLQWACDHRRDRLTSGLVEQQRMFMKLRDKAGIEHG